MTVLKLAGFFRELRHGRADGPSLKESILADANPEEHLILGYLRSGSMLILCPGLGTDPLKQDRISGALSIYTDGIWAWGGDLAYFVANYHVQLPPRFLEHMKKAAWTPRKLSRDELRNLQLPQRPKRDV